MLTSDYMFILYFLPAALLFYYITPKKFRNVILFISGAVFFCWGQLSNFAYKDAVFILDWKQLWSLIFIIFLWLFNYLFGFAVAKTKKKKKSTRKAALVFGVFVNVCALLFFKYAAYTAPHLNPLYQAFDKSGRSIVFKWVILPLGLSFFILGAISYLVDIYRERAKVCKNPFDFGAYALFFPRLIAGSSLKFHRAQLRGEDFDFESFAAGVKRFVTGLAKKLILASMLFEVWNKNLTANIRTVAGAWLGLVALVFALYYELSGFADIAIGAGCMFGFKLPENFNYPFTAKSLAGFYKRFLKSVYYWFYEYFYLPTHGKKRKKGRVNYFGIIFIWLLAGLWLANGLSGLLFGVFTGTFIAFEKAFEKELEKCPRAVGTAYTFIAVLIGFALLIFPDFLNGTIQIMDMAGFNKLPFINRECINYLLSAAVLFPIAVFGVTKYPKRLYGYFEKLCEKKPVLRIAAHVVTFILLVICISFAYSGQHTGSIFKL